MGRIAELAESVKDLFESLEGETERFKAHCGLDCLAGCSACCAYPHIEATTLEFLPFACAMTQAGQGEAALEALDARGEGCPFHVQKQSSPQWGCGVAAQCETKAAHSNSALSARSAAEVLLRTPQAGTGFCRSAQRSLVPRSLAESALSPQWGCGIYPHRGLVCRLFGFSATRDKVGKPIFAACRTLKAAHPSLVSQTHEKIVAGLSAPIMPDYGLKLAALEPELGARFHPLRQAMRKALELALLEHHYESVKVFSHL